MPQVDIDQTPDFDEWLRRVLSGKNSAPKTRALAGRPTVLPSLPPAAYGLSGLYRASEARRNASVKKLIEMGEYARRVVRFRHTGLPTLLAGYLPNNQPLVFEKPDSLVKVSSDWLFSVETTGALFGTDPTFAQQEFTKPPRLVVFTDVDLDKTSLSNSSDTDIRGTTFHATYQHYYQNYPVFGSIVVTHGTHRTPRIAASSSYLPVQFPGGSPTRQVGPERAIELARSALAFYLADELILDPEQHDLKDWVEIVGQLDPNLGGLLKQIGFISKEFKNNPEMDQSGVAETLLKLEGMARQAQGQISSLMLQAVANWEASFEPYAGADVFVLPFNGEYFLAYQVVLMPSRRFGAWRVFVNAMPQAHSELDGFDVLGEPERMHQHDASVFINSQDAIDDAPSKTLMSSEASAVNAIGIKTTFLLDGSTTPTDVTTLVGQTNLSQSQKDALNIAYHLKKAVSHTTNTINQLTFNSPQFNSADVATALGQTVIAVQVGVAANGQVETGFDHGGQPGQRQIVFQNGDGTVMEGTQLLTVNQPSHDPDVIYHEAAHAIMWLLHASPFEMRYRQVPYARALTEGYANFLGRSIGTIFDQTPGSAWALSAYAAWGTRWDLTSALTPPDGKTHLPVPNIYPNRDGDTTLSVYYVGMIWARAMWAMRTQPSLNPLLVDRLAMAAFYYAHGYATNFEAVAEGFLEELTWSNIGGNVGQTIGNEFATRGFLANRGVQATLVFSATEVFVGTDQGLWKGSFNTAVPGVASTWSWTSWATISGTTDMLKGIVGLAEHKGKVYAATENGVYVTTAAVNGWSKLVWTENGLPISSQKPELVATCVVSHNGALFVGTSTGIWVLRDEAETPASPANQLKVWYSTTPGSDSDIGVLTLASGCDGDLYVATIIKVFALINAKAEQGPVVSLPTQNKNIPGTIVLALASSRNGIYAGTMVATLTTSTSAAVRSRTCAGSSWNALPALPVAASVLGLAELNGQVYAGTTQGLYVLTANSWAHPSSAPLTAWLQDQVILRVSAKGSLVIVGDANAHVAIFDGTTWKDQTASGIR